MCAQFLVCASYVGGNVYINIHAFSTSGLQSFFFGFSNLILFLIYIHLFDQFIIISNFAHSNLIYSISLLDVAFLIFHYF